LKRRLILALVLMPGMVGTASAATITQSYCCTPGPTYNYNGTAVEDSTRGGEMGGMTVTAILVYQSLSGHFVQPGSDLQCVSCYFREQRMG
jgi:hypothetical protein